MNGPPAAVAPPLVPVTATSSPILTHWALQEPDATATPATAAREGREHGPYRKSGLTAAIAVLLPRRNPGRLPRHELEPGRPLRPDRGEAQRHRAILAFHGHLVHRRAGDDRHAAVGARLHVAVRRHLAVLHAARAHGVDVLRLVVADTGGVVVREVDAEHLLHR